MAKAFQIHPTDNVATLLGDVEPGRVELVGHRMTLTAREGIKLGHKIAIEPIPSGAAVIKYGVPIGHATREIQAGGWVHLHNLASNFDERSGTLDSETGAPTDTIYE
jgi:altronate dehydratase small subunit